MAAHEDNLGEFPYRLKEGENPFWCAIVDGFNPLKPHKRKFKNTLTRVSLIIVHNDPVKNQIEVNKTYVNKKFLSEDVHVFEFYG